MRAGVGWAGRGMGVSRRVLFAGVGAATLAGCGDTTGTARSSDGRMVAPLLPPTSPVPRAAIPIRPGAIRPGAIPAATPVPVALPLRIGPALSVHDVLPAAPANAVALTLDDGPDPYWTPRILEVLAVNKVQATFSLIGAEVRANPDLVRRIIAAGHGVCNHSFTHPQPFNVLTSTRLDREIATTQAIIVAEAGVTPRLFRPPGGTWNQRILTAAAEHGLAVVDWNIDPRDWARPSAAVITSRLLRARPGDILLCHDGGGNRAETLAALSRTLPMLIARGYHFLTL